MSHADDMKQPDRRLDTTLVTILVIIAAVVVLALTVVLLRGAPKAIDLATPEGVVQAYSAAVISDDRASAISHLSKDLAGNCDSVVPISGMRVTLVSSSVQGDTATVRVRISTNEGGGPFGASEYTSDDAFTLTKNGEWTITSTPWQLTVCYPEKSSE